MYQRTVPGAVVRPGVLDGAVPVVPGVAGTIPGGHTPLETELEAEAPGAVDAPGNVEALVEVLEPADAAPAGAATQSALPVPLPVNGEFALGLLIEPGVPGWVLVPVFVPSEPGELVVGPVTPGLISGFVCVPVTPVCAPVPAPTAPVVPAPGPLSTIPPVALPVALPVVAPPVVWANARLESESVAIIISLRMQHLHFWKLVPVG
jgi:hypothetical protein